MSGHIFKIFIWLHMPNLEKCITNYMKFLFYHWGSYLNELLFFNEATPKNPLIHTTQHILPQGTDCIQ